MVARSRPFAVPIDATEVAPSIWPEPTLPIIGDDRDVGFGADHDIGLGEKATDAIPRHYSEGGHRGCPACIGVSRKWVSDARSGVNVDADAIHGADRSRGDHTPQGPQLPDFVKLFDPGALRRAALYPAELRVPEPARNLAEPEAGGNPALRASQQRALSSRHPLWACRSHSEPRLRWNGAALDKEAPSRLGLERARRRLRSDSVRFSADGGRTAPRCGEPFLVSALQQGLRSQPKQGPAPRGADRRLPHLSLTATPPLLAARSTSNSPVASTRSLNLAKP